MALTFRKLHPHFVAESGPVDLRQVHDPETLAGIRAGMDEFAVLVFHDQPFADDEHLSFAQRLDGELHTKLGSSALVKNRFGNEALGDISNLDENGDSRITTWSTVCSASRGRYVGSANGTFLGTPRPGPCQCQKMDTGCRRSHGSGSRQVVYVEQAW